MLGLLEDVPQNEYPLKSGDFGDLEEWRHGLRRW